MSRDAADRDRASLLPAALLSAAEHDVRTLLTSIETGARTLASGRLSADQLATVGDLVADASGRLSNMLGELVETAGEVMHDRPATGPVDVVSTVDATLHAQGAAPAVVTRPGGLQAVTSEVLLRHLVANLVANAVTAAGARSVTVEIATSDDTHVDVTIRNPISRAEQSDTDVDPDVLHLGAGRGTTIARVLAEAADIGYACHQRGGEYVVRLAIPNRVRHPSTLPPEADRQV